jgi:broad specificity phosphatase PhoE
MKLYFVRHGESEANLLREFSNRGLKHGLTDKGRTQAAELAQKLKGTPVAKIFSSPLLRAAQTTEILAATLGKPYQLTGALREYDCGVLEGKSDAASWAWFDRVFQDWLIDHKWETRIEGGESFLDIKARFVPFIEALLETYSSEDLILVGHGGLYRCMLPLILTNVDFQFTLTHHLGNTAYVAAKAGPQGLICLTWDDITLRKA